MSQSTRLAVAQELCLLRPTARTAQELLGMLAERAVQAGYARPSFTEALLSRERAFPTGLPLASPAAIPHADASHVLRPGLAVALLDPPVEFGEMGSEDRTVSCGLVVMLLVDTPEAQVGVLGQMLAALQKPDWPGLLAAATDTEELAERFATLLD